MTDVPKWPSYPIGPHDSIFALGMVSVNYALLEFAVLGIFSAILGLEENLAPRLMFKTTPEMRDKLMREMLPTRQWPENVKDLAQHFIEAHKICYENRNKLMHSNLLAITSNAIILAKMGRDGKATLSNPLLNELRGVADEMKSFFDYGSQLASLIRTDILGIKPKAGDAWYQSWPEKPPPPIPLEYTLDPRPLRPLR
jgi:hypothetical protein